MISIRQFDFSDADYEQRVAIFNATNPVPASVEFERRQDETTLINPGRAHYAVLAVESDSPAKAVGQGRYFEAFFDAEPDKYLISVDILPDHEAVVLRGELYDHLIDHLLPSNPGKLEAWTWEDKPHVIAFLEEHGFHDVHRQRESVLDTADFDAEAFAGLLAQVETDGITLRTYGELSESDPDFLPKVYELEEQLMPDVPWHEQAMQMVPFDEWLVQFDDNPDLLGDAYVIALDGDDYVGSSVLWASQATDRLLFTALTGVLPAYRRRGIATALKVTAIVAGQQRLDQDGRPPLIRTSNEINNPMFQINLRLGFKPAPDSIVFLKSMS